MMVRLWLLSSDDRRLEHQYGLDTRSHVELDALRIDSANRTHGFSYAPAPGRIVNQFIDSMALDPRQTSFVDFGSGKGRVLIHASLRGFRQVIGVEFSDQLVDIARHNAARFQDLRIGARPILTVHGDAAEFPIPDGDCLLHFNNPFNQEVLRAVLRNVERALAGSPRRIWLAYQQLRQELEDSPSGNLELLTGTPFLRELPLRTTGISRRWLFACRTMKLFEVVGSSEPRTTKDASEVHSVAVDVAPVETGSG